MSTLAMKQQDDAVDDWGIPAPVAERLTIDPWDVESSVATFFEGKTDLIDENWDEFAKDLDKHVKEAQLKSFDPTEAQKKFLRVHGDTFVTDPWSSGETDLDDRAAASIVFEFNGNFYVIDGQHRMNHRIALGHPVDAAIVDGEWLKKYGVTDDIFSAYKIQDIKPITERAPQGVKFDVLPEDQGVIEINATMNGTKVGSVSVTQEFPEEEYGPFMPYKEEPFYDEINGHEVVIGIQFLEVDPTARGKGIAEELMTRAMKEIKKRWPGDPIYINASPMGGALSLDALVSFYQRFGFKVLKKYPEHRNALLWRE